MLTNKNTCAKLKSNDISFNKDMETDKNVTESSSARHDYVRSK
jgi:hypothetical protein